MRDIDTIIIHCSATTPDMDIGVTEITDWHVNRNGWSDIGYHYVIRRNGKLEIGRPVTLAGAHARGHNQSSIGICVIGGVDQQGTPDFNFTFEQFKQLEFLIAHLKLTHGIDKVIGHRDVSNKACPCFNVKELYSYE